MKIYQRGKGLPDGKKADVEGKMSHIHVTDLGGGSSRIVIRGKTSGWKYTLYEILEDGKRVFMWEADDEEEIEEYIQDMIKNAEECGEGIPDFVITDRKSGEDIETIREFCIRKEIDYSPLVEKVRKRGGHSRKNRRQQV